MFHKTVIAEVPEIPQWTLMFLNVETLDERLAEINSGTRALPRAFRALVEDSEVYVYVIEPPTYYKIMYGCSG